MKQFLKKFSLTALGAAFVVSMAVSGGAYSNAAYADENDGIMTIAHTVEKPTIGAFEQHNCVVVYPITQNDEHSNTIYVRRDPTLATNLFTLTYHTTSSDTVHGYVVPSTSTSKECVPYGRTCLAYCSDCGNYSEFNNDLMSLHDEASCITTDSMQSGKIKTTYTDGASWSYAAGENSIYRFSVAYKGVVGDGKITPQSIAKETTVTVNGVTFTIYADLTGIKIKSSKNIGCNSYDTMFAFYFDK